MTISEIQEQWQQKWPGALACWSRYVKLSAPHWCLNSADETREGLSGSFAMIRLVDHAVVISLPQILQNRIENYATEILAHEIGHHVFCPADLLDNARLLARTRRGLPTRETFAPMIANLYADLLINDRLQRLAGLKMSEIYQILQYDESENKEQENRLWTLYLRIYEVLWSLPKNQLARGKIDEALDADGVLGARLVRSYAHDWLRGAGRFAMLCLPYLLEDTPQFGKKMRVWFDTTSAGKGGVPDGLIEIEADEIEGAIHPAFDPEISGIKNSEDRKRGESTGVLAAPGQREPFEYGEILRALGIEISDHDVAVKYYRERARPHLIRFPEKAAPQSTEPQIEGLEEWNLGSPLENIDWLSTTIFSPRIVPGLTTMQRIWGEVEGNRPQTTPLDLYLGVDCSGSMLDPQRELSHPVLAGAIVCLSALRAGARVKVVLSGEPGSSISTDGFTRDETEVLRVLTGYLGSGYAFGIHRLAETFSETAERPTHILIVTDADIFLMLEQQAASDFQYNVKTGHGWQIAKECFDKARGGGTYVLHMDETRSAAEMARMKSDGWNVHCILDWPDIVAFARAFVKENYETSATKNPSFHVHHSWL
jgi:hypothetical protein